MADQNLNESVGNERANPLAMTDKATLTMLIVENREEITDLIKPILIRYLGDHAMTEDEMAICTFFNDCILAREADGFDH